MDGGHEIPCAKFEIVNDTERPISAHIGMGESGVFPVARNEMLFGFLVQIANIRLF